MTKAKVSVRELLAESADQRTREQVSAVDKRCRIARMADELMPLWLYYSTRWPRRVT